MPRAPVVDLFCEDAGHEAFARALVLRLAREVGTMRPQLRAQSVRGGHGRAISELKAWQKLARTRPGRPDLLLVLIDANSEGHAAQVAKVEAVVDPALCARWVVGCPDPHVEAWCAADPDALREVTGASPPAPPTRPGRGAYKRWLEQALEAAGIALLNDPMDISAELVPRLDLYRAGRESPSLGRFVDGVRSALTQIREAEDRA